MLRKKLFWIIIGVVVLVGGGGYAAYQTWFAPDLGSDAVTEVQTATVTRGDLSVTVAGSGQLVPSAEAELTFGASGKVMEILVDIGDRVQKDDVLAWIDDAAARQAVAEAEFQVMAAEQDLALAVLEAELAVAQAEANLDVARRELDEMENWKADEEEIAIAKAQLQSNQVAYQTTVAKANLSDATNAPTRISLDQAIGALADAQQAYADAMNPERDWERDIESVRANAADALVSAQQNLELAQANYDLAMVENSSGNVQSAYASLLSARLTLEEAETPPDEEALAAARNIVRERELALHRAELALGEDGASARRQAELALEQANYALESVQEALAGTTLVAPLNGIVTAVGVEVGETANEGTTAIVLADLVNPVVEFWVEETDLSSVGVGNAVDIVFTALPDYTFSGELYQIDPALVTVGQTPAVQCWTTIDISSHPTTLLGDMNVDVEIVSGQATNLLLVPVQALRRVGDDYAVFVVQPDGELEMRLIEVGLQDFVNAAVLSGLEEDEVVTLGGSTTSATTSTGFDGGGMGLPFGGVPGMMGGGGSP